MLVAMLALATLQGPVAPRPPLHYRIDVKTLSEQDLTSVGRGKVVGGITTTGFVTVTMTDSADGQVARVSVDSLTLAPSGAMAAQITPETARMAADSARGAWVNAYAVHGAIRATPRPSSKNPALTAVMQAVGVLFPGLRTNTKVGDTWTDTTKVDADVPGGHQSGNTIARWNVVGVENAGSVVDGVVTTRITTNNQNGQTIKVSTSSHEHLVLGTRGAPTRNATIESQTDVIMTSQQSAAPLPAKNSGSLTLTLLP